jgi:hypothetical protein
LSTDAMRIMAVLVTVGLRAWRDARTMRPTQSSTLSNP